LNSTWRSLDMAMVFGALFPAASLTTVNEAITRLEKDMIQFAVLPSTPLAVLWDYRTPCSEYVMTQNTATPWIVDLATLPTYLLLEILCIIVGYSKASITLEWATQLAVVGSTDYVGKNISVENEAHAVVSILHWGREFVNSSPLLKATMKDQLPQVYDRVLTSRSTMHSTVVGDVRVRLYTMRQTLWKSCKFLEYLISLRGGKGEKRKASDSTVLTDGRAMSVSSVDLDALERAGLFS
jgi:hypothetical protein